MANIKLKDGAGAERTYNGVAKISVPNASGTGYAEFSEDMAGAYTVRFVADNVTYASYAITQGKQMVEPQNPTKTGYAFIGWSTTSGGTVDVTFPYTPTSNITLYAVFVQGGYCTVSGLGSSSPSSVTFTKSNFPMNFETVTKDGNTFIKIPTMYRKVEASSSGQVSSFTISNAKIDNSYEPYPCFVKEDGVTVMDYVLIGKYYSNSTTVMNSVNTSTATQTISNGRANARALGSGYQLYDWQMQKLWQDLIICKMETVDTNSGSGLQNDSLGFYWGTSYNWIDGVSYQGGTHKWAISYKPSAYVDSATGSTTDYQLASYTSGGTSGKEIKELGYDINNKFFNYPISTVDNANFNTYYCDSFYFGTSTTHPVYSVVGYSFAAHGAFLCGTNFDWTTANGVRLCYRPL